MKKWSLVGLAAIVSVLVTCRPVAAAPYNDWKSSQYCTGASGTLSEDVATIAGVICLIANALNSVLTLFAFVGFLMFVYASFTLMISGGSPSNFETAKNTFTYAIFGFVLALSSFVIINIIVYYTGLNSFFAIKFMPDTVSTSG